MSLVNKMLRDLDARRATASDSGLLPPAVSPIPATVSDQKGRALILAGAFVVSALVAWLMYDETAQVSAVPKLGDAPPTSAGTSSAPSQVPTANPKNGNPTDGASRESKLKLDGELMPRRGPLPADTTSGKDHKVLNQPHTGVPRPEKPALAVKAKDVWPQTVPALETASKAPQSARSPADAMAAPDAPTGTIDKQVKRVTADQQAAAEYRLGVLALRQNNDQEAATRFRMALAQAPGYMPARQALANLLIDARQFDEADHLLRAGLEHSEQPGVVLTLARLQVERGEVATALELLQKHRESNSRNPDYQGFFAALLNRVGRHDEAVARYQDAIQLAPNEARWWAGMGIAFDAAGKGAEAVKAYKTANGLPGLPAELAAHIAQRLK